jgi:hypothetical protein
MREAGATVVFIKKTFQLKLVELNSNNQTQRGYRYLNSTKSSGVTYMGAYVNILLI